MIGFTWWFQWLIWPVMPALFGASIEPTLDLRSVSVVAPGAMTYVHGFRASAGKCLEWNRDA